MWSVEKLFLALSLAAVVLCTALAFSFAVPLQAAEPQVLPDTTGLEQYVLVDLNTADLSALCTLPGVSAHRRFWITGRRMARLNG